MDTRDLMDIILKVRPNISPVQAYDYTLFFEKHDALPKDRLKEVHDDLYKILGDLSQVDKDSAHSMKIAMAEAGQPLEDVVEEPAEDSVEDFPEGKYLPGGMLHVIEYKRAVKTTFPPILEDTMRTALTQTSYASKDFIFGVRNVSITGLDDLKVLVGAPKLVYHPYSVVSRNDKNAQIRDLVSGMIHNTADFHETKLKYDYIQEYEGKCDAGPISGSKVNKPVIPAENILFYPKATIDVILECCNPLNIIFDRETRARYKDKFHLNYITTTEKWQAKIGSELAASYEFHCNNWTYPLVRSDTFPKISFDFKESKIIGIDKNIEVESLSYFVGSALGLMGLVGSFVVTGSALSILAIPIGLSLGLSASGYSKIRVALEKPHFIRAIDSECKKGTIKTTLFGL